MADDTTPAEEPTKPGILKLVLCGFVGFVIGASGFAIPLFLPQLFGQAEAEAEAVQEPIKPAFLQFGESVANLESEKFNRYLKLQITLQVDERDLESITADVERHRAILKSWLLRHLSDKNMDEVRGAAGQNQLRREIQDYFNSVLFTDGVDRIHDVLFEEFNVQ